MNEDGSREAESGHGYAVRQRFTASSGAVSAVLSNGWLYSTWMVGASRMREVDDAWPNPGSTLRHSFGVWPLLINDTTTVREWRPNSTMVLRARGWPVGETRVAITMTDLAGGCEVAIREEVTSERWPGFLSGPRQSLLRLRNRETLRRLRFIAEGSAGSGAVRPDDD